MAAGHANLRQRRELVGGILDRAADEPRHARRLRLLAASCLETMTTVPDDLVRRLDEAVGALVPPRRASDHENLPLPDVEPLRDLTALTNLQLQNWKALPPLGDIPIADGLRSLGLGRLAPDADLAPVLERTGCRHLILQGDGDPPDLSGLAHQTALDELWLEGFDLRAWLPIFENMPPALTSLALYNCRVATRPGLNRQAAQPSTPTTLDPPQRCRSSHPGPET